MTAVRPESSAGSAGRPGHPGPTGPATGPGPAGPPYAGPAGPPYTSGRSQPPPPAGPPYASGRSDPPPPAGPAPASGRSAPPPPAGLADTGAVSGHSRESGYPPPRSTRPAHDPYGAPQPHGRAPGTQPRPAPPPGGPGSYGPQRAPQGAPEPYGHPEARQAPGPGHAPLQGRDGGTAEPPRPAPRRQDRLEATAEMPVPGLDGTADRRAEPVRRATAARRAGGPGGTDTAPVTGGTDFAPVTGGRAERRKAARRGGRRRRPATAAVPLAPPPGQPAAPVSRVEARRAAKAAKPGVGVIVSQTVGELFITLGVLMLLFVVYQLWYTNVLADEQSSGATDNLQHSWASDSKNSSDAGEPSSFPHGTDFAIIYIPKLDVKAPVAEGTDKATILDKGDVGHYDGAQETAMPWARTGNFALAGHRNTHGEPFRYINKLVPGDKVVVETKGMYYTYAITRTLPQTSPANVSVIEPVPPQSGFTGPGRYITLTTCTPEFTSEFRLIVWGKMVAEQPRTQGMPPALPGG